MDALFLLFYWSGWWMLSSQNNCKCPTGSWIMIPSFGSDWYPHDSRRQTTINLGPICILGTWLPCISLHVNQWPATLFTCKYLWQRTKQPYRLSKCMNPALGSWRKKCNLFFQTPKTIWWASSTISEAKWMISRRSNKSYVSHVKDNDKSPI